MKKHDVVCNIAAGVGGLIWPPLLWTLLGLVVTLVLWLLHLTLPEFPWWVWLFIVTPLSIAAWISQGMNTAKWIKHKCSGR